MRLVSQNRYLLYFKRNSIDLNQTRRRFTTGQPSYEKGALKPIINIYSLFNLITDLFILLLRIDGDEKYLDQLNQSAVP